MVVKYIYGLASGGVTVICPIYVVETAPKQYVGGSGAILQIFVAFGFFIATAINIFYPAYPKEGLLLHDDNAKTFLIWTPLIPFFLSLI